MSPDPQWPWSALGLGAMPPDASDIRRAYAKALKQIDQSKDIEGFANLRAAYVSGLAIREGRTSQNTAKRARKAQATAQNTPATDIDDAPPAPQAPTADQIAAKAKAAARDDLLTYLATPNAVAHAGWRIADTLANPLSHDPDCAPSIRFAIASLLRNSVVSDEYSEPALPPEISAETLFALDARYGWLNDYSAFRQDFWGNTELQNLMATRAYGNISRPAAPIQKGRGGIFAGFKSVFDLAPLFVILIYYNLMKVLIYRYNMTFISDLERTLLKLVVIIAVAPLFWLLRPVWRSISDDVRRAPLALIAGVKRLLTPLIKLVAKFKQPK